jgi:hypothetical protein
MDTAVEEGATERGKRVIDALLDALEGAQVADRGLSERTNRRHSPSNQRSTLTNYDEPTQRPRIAPRAHGRIYGEVVLEGGDWAWPEARRVYHRGGSS